MATDTGTERRPAPSTSHDDEREAGPDLGRFGVWAAIALGAYHLWTGYSGGLRFYRHRSIHLIGAMLVLGIIAIQRCKGPHKRAKQAAIASAMAIFNGLFLWVFVNDQDLLTRTAKLPMPMLIWGGVTLLIGLEASRRIIGWMLPALALGFALLVVLAEPLSLPGSGWLAPVKGPDMLNTLVFSGHGILGSITGVSAGIVASFLVFGAFLSASGGAQSFLNLARFLVGRYRGGPAKVSLVTSAFFGTVSGSAVANVVVDGVFNIPLMKRSGYRASFAAGVEAAASAGGQLVPPVMGAAAFIMAEFTGIPYSRIVIAAILPTLLYYVGLGIAIHLEAMKQNLPPIPKEQLPKVRDFLNREFFGSFFVPIGVLLFSLYGLGRSLIFASFAATMTVVAFILFGIREPISKRLGRLVEGLREAGVEIARIAAIVIAAQLIVAVLGTSGLGARVANELSGTDIPTALSLAFLAIVVVILGFGVPTAAAYILAATLANPIFGFLGIDTLAGHMFILYVAVYANVTPPVMPAIYAAAGIARADVMRAGIDGSRLLAPAVLVPFAFVLEPGLLLTHGSVMGSVLGVVRVLVGMSAVSVGLAFWLVRPLPAWVGVSAAAGGALLAWPGLVTSVVGLALMVPAAVLAWQARGTSIVEAEVGAGVVAVARHRQTIWRGEEWDTFVGKVRELLHQQGAGPDRAVVLGGPPSASAVAALRAATGLGAPVVLVPEDLDPGLLPEVLGPVASGVAVAVLPSSVHAPWEDAGILVEAPVDFQLLSTSRQAPRDAEEGDEVRISLTRGAIWHPVAATVSADDRRTRAREVAAAFGVTPADIVLVDAPLDRFMTAPLIDGALEVEARIVVDEELHFDPRRWLELVGEVEATAAVVTHEQLVELVELVEHCEQERPEIPVSLSAVIHGGDPCEESLKRRAIEVFGPILIEYYGTTEVVGTVIVCEDWLEHPASVGRTWSDTLSIRMTDETGRGSGRHVAFEVHDPLVDVAYIDGDQLRPVFSDGVFVTGDRGRMDQGYLYLDMAPSATADDRRAVRPTVDA